MRLHIIWITASLLLSFQVWAANPVPTVSPTPPTVAANAYLLLDHNSNKVLAEKNANMKIDPASLTKMLTMYIVDSELNAGKLKLTDEVIISTKAWRSPGTRMFVEPGTKVQVSELIKGVIIHSGNDASIALAEHIAGSEQVFANLMNDYAKMLGMHDSHFVNATGMPDKEHYTTAFDLAILSRAIIRDFPDSYKLYAQKEYTYNNIKQPNRNRLLWRNSLVDGIKTGFCEAAGYCLVASGIDSNDMRLISIVTGTKSDNARNEEANKLLNWGFRFYETHLVAKHGTPLQDAKIYMGKNEKIKVGFAGDLYITSFHGAYKKYHATTNILSMIKAPIKKGDIVGMYVVQNANKEVVLEEPIIALEDVVRGNLWQRAKDYMSLNVKALYQKYST